MKCEVRNAECGTPAVKRRRLLLPVAFALAALFVALLSGCASSRPSSVVTNKPFVFQQDTLAYANQLVWEYYFDTNGKWRSKPREPKPDYTHHCFVVARSARQFFEHARFDPTQPLADNATY